MGKKGRLAEIQRLTFAEKIARLSETDTAYLEDCIDKAKPAAKSKDVTSQMADEQSSYEQRSS